MRVATVEKLLLTCTVYLMARKVQQEREQLEFLVVLVFVQMNQVCHVLLVSKEMESQRILDIRWPLFGLEYCWDLKTINSL